MDLDPAENLDPGGLRTDLNFVTVPVPCLNFVYTIGILYEGPIDIYQLTARH